MLNFSKLPPEQLDFVFLPKILFFADNNRLYHLFGINVRHSLGKEVSDNIVGKVLESCIHAVPLSTWTMQQLDQVRRDAFKLVLPGHLLPLIKLLPGKHSSLFGDDLKDRQKFVQADAELAETLTGRQKHKQTSKMQTQTFWAPADKPYSYQARTKAQPTPSAHVRRQKPQSGMVSYSFANNKFCAGNLRNFNQTWMKLVADHFVLDIISEGVKLDFIAPLKLLCQSFKKLDMPKFLLLLVR